jgi:hypothetical protein
MYMTGPNRPFDDFLNDNSALGEMCLKEYNLDPRMGICDLQRKVYRFKSNKVPSKKLTLRFEQVDTEELRNVEIDFNGGEGIFKIGDGESAHYHIPNDKKLWETQFMICCIDGRFFIRDMGFVHTTRMKLDG